MNICMLQYAHDLPDLRIESEARRLARAGHRILIVCERQASAEYQIAMQNISTIRIKIDSPFFLAVNRIIFMLFLVDCFWLLTLIKLQRQHRFEVFHIRDLPIARTVQILAWLLNRSTVLDLYENYPVVIQAFWPQPMSLKDQIQKRLFFSLKRWKRYECRAVRAADHVIVVVEEAKMRVHSLAVPKEKITIVGNSLKGSFMLYPKRDSLLERQFAGKLILSYVGSIYLSVALDTVFIAMPMIIAQAPNAHLLVVAENTQVQAYGLKKTITRLCIENHVTFIDWQPLERMPAFMTISSLGLLPFKPDEHHSSTVYNKLFQYMYMRVPVIVSKCKPAERIVTEAGCGLVIPGTMNDPKVFAENVIGLLANEHLRLEMGRRGNKAVLSKYLWDEDGDRLANLYEKNRLWPRREMP